MAVTPRTDSSGNTYFDVGNIRITCVPKAWNGQPGIRVQAYRDDGGLFQGAELPVPDKETAFELIQAIHEAFKGIGL